MNDIPCKEDEPKNKENKTIIDIISNKEVHITNEEMENILKQQQINSKTTRISEIEQNHESVSCLENKFDLFELSRHLWKSTYDKQQYTRGCLWSPDGTCILTAVNLDGMHIFELPSTLYELNNDDSITNERPFDVLESVIHVKEGGTVYDFCWYPLMDSNYPETCFWIATRQHEPIHIWDAYNGTLRSTYRGYSAADEVETAISVIFSNDGYKIYGGYKKSIKIFDTNIPGREYVQIDIKKPCSCFALHNIHKDLITFGSWNSTIHICDLRSPDIGCLVTLSQHFGGVTYMKFSNDGVSLYSGARKDNQLIQWDMRNFNKPIQILKRHVTTNQKIYFDLTSSSIIGIENNNCLISGDTKGVIHAWDLNNNYNENVYQLHEDCCNGISLHPKKPILATTSGQYHFLTEEEETNGQITKKYENSLTLWWYGNIKEENKV